MTHPNIMVCSKCGNVIDTKSDSNSEFDTYDISWKCPHCGELWMDSDGWAEIGNVLIPYREKLIGICHVCERKNTKGGK